MDVERTEQMIETLLVAILGTAAGELLARESSALLCQLNRTLLDRGLHRLLGRLPPDARDRRRGKIEADFEAYSERPVAGLLFAVRLCWTAPRRSLRRVLAPLTEWLEDLVDDMIEGRRGERLRTLRPPVMFSPGLAGARVFLEMERHRREGG